ncbi:VTT domain-containing protein [Paraburkholderia sediminicola]|uniref:VTT domain-containing protein n=1 Tax=Paraburkholderia sediminicola TaxID=458836 RepID=UPI0038B994B4
MSLAELSLRSGWLFVFLSVFVTSVGIPVPAILALIMAGATIQLTHMAGGQMWLSLVATFAAAVTGGALADAIWFYAGRTYGHRTLNLICRLSLSKDTCVKRAERLWGYWGPPVLLSTRFIPGLSLVSTPLAGAMRVKWSTFLFYDCAGTAAWSAVGLGIGMTFATQLEAIIRMFHRLGRATVFAVLAALVVCVIHRWYGRRRFAATLEKSRISAQAVHAMIQDGRVPAILDVRSSYKRLIDPVVIPGAKFANDHDIQPILANYDPAQTTVIYCSCPNEVSAALVASALRKAGFRDPLPLSGGLEAWRAAGFPVETTSSFENFQGGKSSSFLYPWPIQCAEGQEQTSQ